MQVLLHRASGSPRNDIRLVIYLSKIVVPIYQIPLDII